MQLECHRPAQGRRGAQLVEDIGTGVGRSDPATPEPEGDGKAGMGTDDTARCLARSSVRHIVRSIGSSAPRSQSRSSRPSGRRAVSGGRRLASGDPLAQRAEVCLDAEHGGHQEQHEERRDHQAEHDGDRHGDQELRLEAGLEQ
jgi:hypothetical protein